MANLHLVGVVLTYVASFVFIMGAITAILRRWWKILELRQSIAKIDGRLKETGDQLANTTAKIVQLTTEVSFLEKQIDSIDNNLVTLVGRVPRPMDELLRGHESVCKGDITQRLQHVDEKVTTNIQGLARVEEKVAGLSNQVGDLHKNRRPNFKAA